MNHYKLADIHVGMQESFSVTVTEDMLRQFFLCSGDSNPLHNNEQYALEHGYPGRVVFGMLCASLFSTLAGVYLPGEHCLLHEVSTKFKKPVFVGDTLTVTGTISDKSAALRRISVAGKITNQHGDVVNKATIQAGVSA